MNNFMTNWDTLYWQTTLLMKRLWTFTVGAKNFFSLFKTIYECLPPFKKQIHDPMQKSFVGWYLSYFDKYAIQSPPELVQLLKVVASVQL